MDEVGSPHELVFGEAFLLVIILCHHLEKLSRFEEKRLGSDIVVTRKNWPWKIEAASCSSSALSQLSITGEETLERVLSATGISCLNNFAIDAAGNPETTRKFSAGPFGTKERDSIELSCKMKETC